MSVNVTLYGDMLQVFATLSLTAPAVDDAT